MVRKQSEGREEEGGGGGGGGEKKSGFLYNISF